MKCEFGLEWGCAAKEYCIDLQPPTSLMRPGQPHAVLNLKAGLARGHGFFHIGNVEATWHAVVQQSAFAEAITNTFHYYEARAIWERHVAATTRMLLNVVNVKTTMDFVAACEMGPDPGLPAVTKPKGVRQAGVLMALVVWGQDLVPGHGGDIVHQTPEQHQQHLATLELINDFLTIWQQRLRTLDKPAWGQVTKAKLGEMGWRVDVWLSIIVELGWTLACFKRAVQHVDQWAKSQQRGKPTDVPPLPGRYNATRATKEGWKSWLTMRTTLLQKLHSHEKALTRLMDRQEQQEVDSKYLYTNGSLKLEVPPLVTPKQMTRAELDDWWERGRQLVEEKNCAPIEASYELNKSGIARAAELMIKIKQEKQEGGS